MRQAIIIFEISYPKNGFSDEVFRPENNEYLKGWKKKYKNLKILLKPLG